MLKTYACTRCGKPFEAAAGHYCKYCADCKVTTQREQARDRQRRMRGSTPRPVSKKYKGLSPIAQDNAVARAHGMDYGHAVAAGIVGRR